MADEVIKNSASDDSESVSIRSLEIPQQINIKKHDVDESPNSEVGSFDGKTDGVLENKRTKCSKKKDFVDNEKLRTFSFSELFNYTKTLNSQFKKKGRKNTCILLIQSIY